MIDTWNFERKNLSSNVYSFQESKINTLFTPFQVIQFRTAAFWVYGVRSAFFVGVCANFTFSCIIWRRIGATIICEIK